MTMYYVSRKWPYVTKTHRETFAQLFPAVEKMSRIYKITNHESGFEKQKNTRRSKFFEPKDLRRALMPLHVICMIIGIEVIQMPLGKPRLGISRAYAIILVIMTCAMSVKIVRELFFGANVINISVTESYGYCVIIFGNIAMTMLHVSMTPYHAKNSSEIFKDIVDIDEVLHWLGIPYDHKRIFARVSVGLTASILLSFFIFEEVIGGVHSKLDKLSDHFWLLFAIHYTITVHILGDVYFVSKCWLLMGLFAKMNLKLRGLQISYINEFALKLPKFELSGKLPKMIGNSALNVEDKISVMDTIRVLHRRNRSLTKAFSEIFWTKNMFGATLCFIVVTMNLFSIYRLLSIFVFSNVRLIVARFLWISFWLAKLFLMIRSRMMVDKEARETGEILLRFSEEDPQMKREIQAFSIEVMQSWKSSSINRELNFDYAFLKQFLMNVMTYCVSLIQGDTLSENVPMTQTSTDLAKHGV